jgi:hypothetical protein
MRVAVLVLLGVLLSGCTYVHFISGKGKSVGLVFQFGNVPGKQLLDSMYRPAIMPRVCLIFWLFTLKIVRAINALTSSAGKVCAAEFVALNALAKRTELRLNHVIPRRIAIPPIHLA